MQTIFSCLSTQGNVTCHKSDKYGSKRYFFLKKQCDNVTAIVTEHQEEENLGDLCC